MWVKVCGVTTRDAAATAVAAGADAIGINLIEGPRRIRPEQAPEITAGLDVERVALIDEPSAERALHLLEELDVTAVQPYGPSADAVAQAAARAGYLVLRPVPVDTRVEVSSLPPDQLPLLDTRQPHLRGGTGMTFDWSLAREVSRPVVVAGGIGPDNVRDVIETIRPWGVDASSRLESTPGRKDLELVRAFVTNAKQAQS